MTNENENIIKLIDTKIQELKEKTCQIQEEISDITEKNKKMKEIIKQIDKVLNQNEQN